MWRVSLGSHTLGKTILLTIFIAQLASLSKWMCRVLLAQPGCKGPGFAHVSWGTGWKCCLTNGLSLSWHQRAHPAGGTQEWILSWCCDLAGAPGPLLALPLQVLQWISTWWGVSDLSCSSTQISGHCQVGHWSQGGWSRLCLGRQAHLAWPSKHLLPNELSWCRGCAGPLLSALPWTDHKRAWFLIHGPQDWIHPALGLWIRQCWCTCNAVDAYGKSKTHQIL